MRPVKHILLVLLTWIALPALSQTSYLHRRVTLDMPNCSLEVALKEIGKAGQFRFSYDADLIQPNRRVELKARNTTVSTLLREMLGREVTPKEVGNHVILVRSREMAKEKKSFSDIVVKGLIFDGHNRNPLHEATVYETENKRSAVTSTAGAYKLIIPTGRKVRSLTFCKAGYIDTVIFVTQVPERTLNVILRPVTSDLSYLPQYRSALVISPTDTMSFVNWLVPNEARVNARNLEVRTSRTFQASIIPYIGTNWRVTGSVTNRFSLNLLAGYTGGLKGLEVGGLLNIDRTDISGVQIGGLGNIVGGKGSGWQIGGLFNFDLGRFSGVQIGGLMNYVPDTIRGVQIGGLTNIVTGGVKGVQIAGLANVVTSRSDGWQIAGLTNITLWNVRKVQISGLFNLGRNLDGVQVSGLVNVATRYNSGVQVAGLLNYADHLTGLQLGLINISKKVERGVPIGLFSYVQQGYHLFEISGNEIFYGNASFKSGTRAFYNFVQVGMGSDYKLQASYGIGTIFTLKKNWSMNIDASAGFVYHPTDTVYHGLLLKFNPAVEYRFAKHFALFLGPAYNCFVFSKGEPSATPRGLSTYDFYFTSTENASIQMWIGGVLGIRL